uniref:Methionyl-tRNA formyltransferase, mitochondrial n=1 Tax=Culex tarsalis TaxID=7177 RepID=A0A1Q3F175_CULTA
MKILQNMCRNVFEYRRKVLLASRRFHCTSTSENSRMRILFFGTDNFSLPSLRILNDSLKSKGTVSSLEVVTSFKATKNPLKRFAAVENLRLHDWPLQKTGTEVNRNFDLGVVVSFGHLIPEALISSFRLGMLNVHASLLPKLRGAAPIVHAIASGLTETGVTIMRIKPRHFDVGEILTQRHLPIARDTLMPELHGQLANVGAAALLHCVDSLDRYYRCLRTQDDGEATYAPKITPQFADIRWAEMGAREVYDRFRALYSYKPLTTRFGGGELVKIFRVSCDGDGEVVGDDSVTGQMRFCRKSKRLWVRCGDGKMICVEQLSIGGKKVMSGQEFYNGFLSKLEPARRVFSY